ncbi:hypothetical protein REPUB_Repub07fG0117900 [Reevesia pubescens]
MDDNYEALWEKLRLTDEEATDVHISRDWLDGTFKDGEYCLIAKPGDIVPSWYPFWIQIHDLPLGLMNARVGMVIGESLGDVEEVEFDTNSTA